MCIVPGRHDNGIDRGVFYHFTGIGGCPLEAEFLAVVYTTNAAGAGETMQVGTRTLQSRNQDLARVSARADDAGDGFSGRR